MQTILIEMRKYELLIFIFIFFNPDWKRAGFLSYPIEAHLSASGVPPSWLTRRRFECFENLHWFGLIGWFT